MAELIERLMGLAANGVDPAPATPSGRRIPVHEFAAACYEVAFGPRTVAQIKTHYSMTVAQQAELDALIALVAGQDAVKHRIIFQFEQVLILAERHVSFYDTPALVRTRLGIP